MSKITNLLIFASGAAIGSAVTWKLLKTKYEQIAREEIESVKEVFSKRYSDKEESTEEVDDARAKADAAKEKPDISAYAATVRNMGYTNEEESAEEEEEDMDRPYVISPDEFGENPDYETVSLTYFNDKVLVDDNNDLVEDVDDIVGLDSLNSFGEYEDDSVFVRNDRLKTDYEILYDMRDYSDVEKGSSVTED